jgi:molybdate transport system ATP-binding protein
MLKINVKKRLSKDSNGSRRSGNNERAGDFTLDIEFAAAPDGITILSGASGSGKTTTLRLVAGILAPDEGTISVGSTVYFDSHHGINLPIQQRRVGFVFQDYALFPHLNAAENIAYGIKNADKKTRLSHAREMLSLFRIESLGKRLPRELSGGEQQRVALARALASDPKVLLLDEPLSAVDSELRAKLLDEIAAAQQRAKIPFLYVTHNEAEAERLGSRHIALRAGRIV